MRIYNYKYSPGEQKAKKKSFVMTLWKRLKWPKLDRKKTFTRLFRIAAAGILFIALLFLYYAKDLPDPNKLLARNVAQSTKIFARGGELLYEIHGEEKRTLVELDQISPYAKNATVAIEDKDFYKHHGISFTGILRSMVRYVINRGPSGGGGSTLTQQFVKNAILNNRQTPDRKIREAMVSILIETRFTKDEILKLYLNEIPYGRNAYGIEAAAQTYFNKSAKDISLAQSAYLAALPQSPTRYNPFGPNRELLDARKDTVLLAMRKQGYITEEEEKQAKEEKVEFQKIKNAILAPHFVLMVQDYLASRYGEKTLQEGGLKVYTTLDLRLQKIAEEAVSAGVEKNIKNYRANNAALVAMDPKTGQILAMVGSKDYFGDPMPEGCTPGKNCLFEPNVNVALSERQPGSSFKPYAYLTAFKKDFKYSPATMLVDVVTNFGSFGGKEYIPHNYNLEENGPLSMRKALAGSLNIPAVKTLALVGVENAVQTARDLGINSPLQDCGLSLVLGGCEVKLVDHVAAYATIANGGVRNDKTAILKIEDREGNILEEYTENSREVVDPQSVYELVSIMTDNNARSFVFGPNSPLILPGRVVAAKTGTTQEWKDGWTLGFTPSLAAGVWTGNNNSDEMKRGADGVLTAAPIWNRFMKEALQDTPAEEFKAPSGIQRISVDEISGKLPTDQTPNTKSEVFASFALPTQYDDVHITQAYDLLTSLPADNLTPPDRIYYKPFTVLHSEKPNTPAWETPVQIWAEAHGYSNPNTLSSSSGGQPSLGEGPNVEIVSPGENTNISSIPFKITVAAISKAGISRVDLSIDGKFVSTSNVFPYTFEINRSYSDGQHVIAAKAVDTEGKSSDTSITVNFAPAIPLALISPQNNKQVELPTTLTAETSNTYAYIDFFYQTESDSPKLIGRANTVSSQQGKYQHSFTWVATLPKGIYELYAESNTAVRSPKVKVTIP